MLKEKHFARSNSLQDLLNSTEIEFDMGFNEVTESIQCLERAWNSAKAILPAYMRETFPQQQAVKFNADQEFNVDSKVSHLLPTTSGDGLPIYVLLHFLSSIHNDLISFYFNKKSIQRGKDDEVELKHFENPEFVISITEDELLRVVQSNFSFDSKNSKCLFRFENISNKIIEKFQDKPLISLANFAVFEYCDEISDSTFFNKLDEVITQEICEPDVQMNIFEEFKNINELSETINLVKIMINYARSTSASREESIGKFLRKIRFDQSHRNAENLLKLNITERCALKHMKHVYVILMTKRSLLLSIQDQDPFESLSEAFKAKNEFELKTFNKNLIIWLTIIINQLVFFRLVTLTEEDFLVLPGAK